MEEQMSLELSDVVSLSAEVGGEDAHAATHEHILALRKLLREKCKGPYSSIVKRFDFALVIDGSVQAWPKEVASRTILKSKRSLAIVDIHMPREKWFACDSASIRMSLVGGVLEAMDKLYELAERKKVDMAFEHFRRDVRTAVEDFL